MPLRRPLQESPKEVSARWVALFVDGNGARSFVLAGGLAVHAVSVFIVATILPDIVRDIGGLAYYAWTSMLFVVGSIGGSVVAPSLLARLGSRASYRVALALFVAGSLVCAAAPAMSVLLAGTCLCDDPAVVSRTSLVAGDLDVVRGVGRCRPHRPVHRRPIRKFRRVALGVPDQCADRTGFCRRCRAGFASG